MQAWLLTQQADIQMQLHRMAAFFAPDSEEVHRHWLRWVQRVSAPLSLMLSSRGDAVRQHVEEVGC